MARIAEAANAVRAAVEADEAKRFVRLTQAELDAIPKYQSTMPTSPRPGSRYRREWWRSPDDGRLWSGPWRIPEFEGWPSVWFVYDVVASSEPGYVDHVPREAKVVA